MDPFLDLVRLLRPSATLWGGGFDARGDWALSFRKRDDLLFCWVERGECLLARPDIAPLRLQPGDFVLIRTATPFRLASSLLIEPVAIEAAIAAAQGARLSLGHGEDRPVTLHAGRFLFEAANEHLLTGLLPPLVHVKAGDAAAAPIRALLAMNEMESRHPGPASEFMITRLMEMVLVEILRTPSLGLGEGQQGLLAGLADPVIARALTEMHSDIARPWTVADLARACGVSRSALATRFRAIVGTGPIDYLSQWRLALAKDELRRGVLSVSEIAFLVGFQSSSAFSTAFSRSVGRSPTGFAAHAMPRGFPG